MSVLPLLRFHPGNTDSHDILCNPARQVTGFSPGLRAHAADLLETMRHHGAAGIAAPQAGIPLRLAVVERDGGQALVLVNPRITAEEGPVSEGIEECLSVPGPRSVVERPHALGVTYQDAAGGHHTLRAEGLPARVIAHELDHLDGILCTVRAARVLHGGDP